MASDSCTDSCAMVPSTSMTIVGSLSRGVNGGQTAAGSQKILFRNCREGELESDARELVPSKCDNYPVKAGDVLHYITWGGGGWGPAWERDAALVQKEVRRGLVSKVGAAKNYGVVMSDSFEIDQAATEQAREQLRSLAPKDGEAAVFNFGWKNGIKATKKEMDRLRAGCKVVTGFEAPQCHYQENADGSKRRKVMSFSGNSHCRACATRF